VTTWPPKGSGREGGDAIARSAALLQSLETGTTRIAGHLPGLEGAAVTWQAGQHQPDALAALVVAHDVLVHSAGQQWGFASLIDAARRAREGQLSPPPAWMSRFASTGNRLHAVDGRPGNIRVNMPPVAAFPRTEGLDADLADLLSNAAIATKLNKLRNHPGVSERHLAIGVSDIYGSGFDLLDNLKMGRRDLPKFEIPDGFAATHLWLTAGGYSILTWNRADGWIWRELPEPD
jgi:hypothetical protein